MRKSGLALRGLHEKHSKRNASLQTAGKQFHPREFQMSQWVFSCCVTSVAWKIVSHCIETFQTSQHYKTGKHGRSKTNIPVWLTVQSPVLLLSNQSSADQDIFMLAAPGPSSNQKVFSWLLLKHGNTFCSSHFQWVFPPSTLIFHSHPLYRCTHHLIN